MEAFGFTPAKVGQYIVVFFVLECVPRMCVGRQVQLTNICISSIIKNYGIILNR